MALHNRTNSATVGVIDRRDNYQEPINLFPNSADIVSSIRKILFCPESVLRRFLQTAFRPERKKYQTMALSNHLLDDDPHDEDCGDDLPDIPDDVMATIEARRKRWPGYPRRYTWDSPIDRFEISLSYAQGGNDWRLSLVDVRLRTYQDPVNAMLDVWHQRTGHLAWDGLIGKFKKPCNSHIWNSN